MKNIPQKKQLMKRIALVAGLIAIGAVQTQAQIIVNNEGAAYGGAGTDNENTYDSYATNTTGDLILAGSSTLAGSVDVSGSVYSASGINDGLTTNYSDPGESGGFGPHDAYLAGPSNTVTFNLNLDPTMGGSAAGYTIESIQSVAGYSGSFSLQDFTLSFETTSSPNTFIQLPNPATTPGAGDYVNSLGFQASMTQISDASGPLATNVTAIQVTYANGLIVRELDAYGTATAVPEPSTWALMFAGLVSLVCLGRFKRQV